MAPIQDPFFPEIRTAAEKTDQLPDVDDDAVKPEGAPAPAEEEERPLQEVDSLCMTCGEQGSTRLLLTSIPFFREVIVMSFRCEHCGNTNNEIQSASTIRDKGCLHTVKVLDRSDLNRQLVKSATCSVVLPEYELTIPPGRGQLTTIEGLIRDTVTDLSADQPLRRIQDEPTWAKIEELLNKLRPILPDDEDEDGADMKEKKPEDEKPIPHFTVKLDDPSGNSFLEFFESMGDPKWSFREYARTREHNIALGLIPQEEIPTVDPSKSVDQIIAEASGTEGAEGDPEHPNEEIYRFPGICSSCGRELDTLMKRVNIPYFKDIFIMSTNCNVCGYRDNEVKSGAAISEKGKKITLRVEDADDLSRDILKSETCGLEIPEIDLTLHAGTLGGRFTTVEGILNQIYEELSEKVFAGDSAAPGDNTRTTFQEFLGKLKEVMTAAHPFTLILNDPLANSYLQNIYAPDPDPNMTIELYERTWEQNEDLGLNDMKVEGYDAPSVEGEKREEEEPGWKDKLDKLVEELNNS
jgi:zinc finger protein